MKKVLLVVAGLCVFAIATHGQKKAGIIYIPTHIYNGEAFLDLDENDKIMYAGGIIDGFLGSSLFGAPNETVDALKACVGGMDTKQVAAIFTKYLKDNPEGWQHPMSVEAFTALSHACPNVLKIVGQQDGK